MLGMETTQASIYDFPTYYDLVFGSDTAAELRFLELCFERFVQFPRSRSRTTASGVKRVFEPACGTGRLLFRMGRKGYEVGGIDLNEKAVEFCNARLAKYQLRGRVMHGDMCDFEVPKPYDASFNTINSFRHLLSEAQAVAHLEYVASATRVGGIYALGLHLTPTMGEATDEEGWSARRGQLSINTYMWPVEKNPKKRIEKFGISFDIYRPTGSSRIEDVLVLRSYTATQFQNLLNKCPRWELVEFFDFRYDIRKPIKLEADTEDVVAILRRIE